MAPNYNEYSPLFKALSDDIRLMIIDMLSSQEMCASLLLEQLNITQPTLSYHMKMLTKTGFVNVRKVKTMCLYSVNREKFEVLKSILSQISSDTDELNA